MMWAPFSMAQDILSISVRRVALPSRTPATRRFACLTQDGLVQWAGRLGPSVALVAQEASLTLRVAAELFRCSSRRRQEADEARSRIAAARLAFWRPNRPARKSSQRGALDCLRSRISGFSSRRRVSTRNLRKRLVVAAARATECRHRVADSCRSQSMVRLSSISAWSVGAVRLRCRRTLKLVSRRRALRRVCACQGPRSSR